LTEWFSNTDPEVIGNDYLIFGTIEKKAWHENITDPKGSNELRHHVSDFLSYQNIHMRMGGWFRNGEDPPVIVPPASTKWVKRFEKPLAGVQMEKAKPDALISINNLGFVTTLRD
jgi:hypothetical protein